MSRTAVPVLRRRLARIVAGFVIAVLAGSGLSAVSETPASAVGTIGFVNAFTDNYKTWDRPSTNNTTSFLFSSITVGATTYVVPQSARNAAPSNGSPETYAAGLPLANTVGGPIVAYLKDENPTVAWNRYRVFPSGVFGPVTVTTAEFRSAAHTPMSFPFTLKDTANVTLAAVDVAYKWDAALAAVPESSVEYLGPRGRWYVGADQSTPTPLNWPSGIAVSSTQGGPPQTAISVPPNTARTLYVAAVDNQGLPIPFFGDAANNVLQLSMGWTPSGAGRPATTTGAGAWRSLPINLPAGTYSLSPSGICEDQCQWNVNNDLDSPFSGPTVTITSETQAPTLRPDGLVRPAGGAYAGDGLYNTNGAGQTSSADVAAGSTATFDVQLQNDGSANDTFLVAGSPSTGVAGFTHEVVLDGAPVTSLVDGGNLSIPGVAAGGTRELTFSVTPAPGTPVGTTATYYLHTYSSTPSIKDVIGIQVTVAPAGPIDPGGGGSLDCTIDRVDGTYVTVANGRIRVYNDMELILPKETGFTGTAAGGSSAATVCAARNSFAAYQLNVGGTTALTIDSVTLPEDLDGPGAATVPKANVRVYREQPVTLNVMSNGTLRDLVPRDVNTGVCSAKCDFSDALLPAVDPSTSAARAAFPLTIPADENRSIWVDIEVPAGQAVGDYEGDVIVRVGGVDRPVHLTLTVLPVTIPSYGSAEAQAQGTDLVSEFRVNSAITQDMDWFVKMARLGLDDRISLLPDGAGWFDDARWAKVAPLLQGTDAGSRLPGARLQTVMVGIYTSTANLAFIKAKLESIGQLGKLAFWCDEGVYASKCAAKLAELRGVWPGLPFDGIPALNNAASDPLTNGPLSELSGVSNIRAIVPEITRIDPHELKSVVNPYSRTTYASRAPAFVSWANAAAGREFWTYVSCMSDGCTPAYGPYQSTDIGYSGWPSYAIDAKGPSQAAIGWQAYLQGFTGEHFWGVDQCRTQAVGPALTGCLWAPPGSAGGSNGDGTLFYHSNQFAFGGTDIPVESLRLKRIRDGRQAYALLQMAKADGLGVQAQLIAHGTVADPVYQEVGVSPSASRYDQAREDLFALVAGITPEPGPVGPSAPLSVTASGGDGRAAVSWLAPAAPGTGGTITYTVTAHRDSPDEVTTHTCATTSLTCTVTGLFNLNPGANPYTFTVVATTSAGSSPASAPSGPVLPSLVGGVIVAPMPLIAGVPVVGTTVGVVTGQWDPDPVTLTYRWYRNGVPIKAAILPSYRLTGSDAGAKITVRVTGAKPGFPTVSRTSTAMTIQRYFTKVPSVRFVGTVAIGSTLSASASGSWSVTPTTRSYRWYRDGEAIVGALSSTYRLTDADAGHLISVYLTGQRTGYTTREIRSGTVLVPYRFTTAPNPTISGALSTGSTLTALTGVWDPVPASFSYQWYRNGLAISKATKSTYKLTSSDVGRSITVRVVAARPSTTSLAARSSAVVGERAFSAVPSLSVRWAGSMYDQARLHIVGGFSPAPSHITVQWLRDGVPIPTWDDQQYLEGEAFWFDYPDDNYGTQLSLRVIASRPGYTSRTITTAAVTIPDMVTWTTAPSVSGTWSVGQLLTLNTGTWIPASPDFEYWWEEEGHSEGSLASTKDYTPVASDGGTRIRVHIFATKPGYYPREWRSQWMYIDF